jgi:hypothetical protein
MDQAKTGFRDMGFDDSKVEAISAQLGVQDTIKLFSRVGKAGSEPSFVGYKLTIFSVLILIRLGVTILTSISKCLSIHWGTF